MPPGKATTGASDSTGAQVPWMVQVVQSCFRAERAAIVTGIAWVFPLGRLPGRPDIEGMATQDVAKALGRATRKT